MAWDAARNLLNNTVVKHLGEELSLESDDGEATVRGVLVRPEELVRLGLSTATVGAARLTMKQVDAPAWLGRGVVVTSERGETFDVTAVTDNGEGILEVTLCQLS
jgi:hypothetical protein